MKKAIVVILALTLWIGCKGQIALKNQTRHAGYAKGEQIRLSFSVADIEQAPDSILVGVVERKSGFHYSLVARKGTCTEFCSYEVTWDGRKPDGRWPMGGRYIVYAYTSRPTVVYSDTVEIGLGD